MGFPWLFPFHGSLNEPCVDRRRRFHNAWTTSDCEWVGRPQALYTVLYYSFFTRINLHYHNYDSSKCIMRKKMKTVRGGTVSSRMNCLRFTRPTWCKGITATKQSIHITSKVSFLLFKSNYSATRRLRFSCHHVMFLPVIPLSSTH